MSLSKVFCFIVLSIVSFNGLTGCGSSNAAKSISETDGTKMQSEAKVGSHAPNFELAKLDGTKISLNDLAGIPAVIVFWTAWCPTCKEEAPQINKLAEDYLAKGVRVLGINIGEGEARVTEGIKDFGIKYEVVRDSDTQVAKRYNVVGTPTVIFLDKTGTIRYIGNELPKDYAERLDAYISEN